MILPLLWSVAAWFAVPAAATQNCAAGQAPGAYSGAACGGHAIDIFGVLYCDVDTTGTSDTEMWAVTDYAATGTDDISVWGTDDAGATFCCFVPASQGVYEVRFESSPQTDDFSFQSGARNLESISATMYGGEQDDILAGSDATTCVETLWGGTMGDTIDGDGGADEGADRVVSAAAPGSGGGREGCG